MILTVPKADQAKANEACASLFGADAIETFTVPWVDAGDKAVLYACGWALMTEDMCAKLIAACPSIVRQTGKPDDILGPAGLKTQKYLPVGVKA